MKNIICIIVILISQFPAFADVSILTQAGENGLTIWSVPEAKLKAQPRWVPGENMPITINECFKIIKENGELPKDAFLYQIAIQSLDKKVSDDIGLNNLYFFIISYFTKNGEGDVLTFVILMDGTIASSRVAPFE